MEKEIHIPRIVRTTLQGVMMFTAFDHLYTEPRIALWELKQRRTNAELKKQILAELGKDSEEILSKFKQPRAVFFRQIATPTHETIRFLKLAKQMKLKPLILEYHDDKFVSSENRSKRSLGKMPIYQYTGTDGRDMVEYSTVCDFNVSTGKKLGEVVCISKETLVALHHRLFRAITGLNPKSYCYDASDWFSSSGKSAEIYYKRLLTLFIRDGVLFENFTTLRSESAFTKSIIVPAFRALEETYGMKPLVVRLLPEHEETRQFWDAYPKKTKKHI